MKTAPEKRPAAIAGLSLSAEKIANTFGMMRKCYAAAMLLISWYLMLPPPVYPPVKDASGEYKMNSGAPLSRWLKFKTLDSEAACKARLKKMPSFYRCIRSDDPALSAPADGARGGPTNSTASGAATNHMQ